MHNAEKLTCDAIYRFILFELSDKINEAIFAKSSIEEVGHYLFDIIVQSVDGASEELIRLVIERTGAHDATYTSLNDYYKQLCCYHMHFKAIPQNVYYKVIREYVNIFRKKYPRLISEIKTSIASKNDEMRHIADQIDRITHSSNIDLRITKNIKDTEQTLFNLSQKCENLQVQKEMLIFSLDYLNECMAKFCNLDNKAEVLKTLRNIALDIATERIRDVASEFQYYYDVITISKSQTRDISRIFYMVKLVKLNEDVKQKAHSMAYQYDGLPEEIVDKLKQEQDKIPRIADLNYTCGLGDMEPGTANYLCGKSLTGNTTDDNYTSFSSEEGQERLYAYMHRLCVPEPLPQNIPPLVSEDGYEETNVFYPKTSRDRVTVTATLLLQPGQTLTLESSHGGTGTIEAEESTPSGRRRQSKKDEEADTN